MLRNVGLGERLDADNMYVLYVINLWISIDITCSRCHTAVSAGLNPTGELFEVFSGRYWRGCMYSAVREHVC